jgi:hypothetical protein
LTRVVDDGKQPQAQATAEDVLGNPAMKIDRLKTAGWAHFGLALVILGMCFLQASCGGGSNSSTTTSPPPPPTGFFYISLKNGDIYRTTVSQD